MVGITTTGLAGKQDLVRAMRPRIIVMEEAAEILEAHTLVALAEETEHLILIGDHEQLRPKP